jgi:hypothetical protein
MILRVLASALLMVWPVIAAGQLSGRFYMEKSTFAPSEPIFLYFEIGNDGSHGESVLNNDPYSDYQVKVSTDPGSNSSCPTPGVLVHGGVPEVTVLLPGTKRVNRLLLNFDHKVSAPGEYSVEANTYLSDPSVSRQAVEVRSTLHFTVAASGTQGAAALQAWVNHLRSQDYNTRREAARTLASIAPQPLEDTLLAFADNPEFQEFAPLALHNLNTPRSIRELANSLPKFDYSERIASVGYLADTGDAQWFPLLQRLAQANPGLRDYVDSAAQLGGDKMLPTLIEWMQSPDVKFTRINAVTAMGYTGSRAAVPILIDLLRSSNPDISGRAQFALRLLTRLTTDGYQFFCRGAEDVFGGKTDFARFAFSKARLENILSCFETETPNASSLRLLWGVGMTTPSILLLGEFG